jgi:phosphotriesterase-related protein
LREVAHLKVTPETRGRIFYHSHLNLDNTKQADVQLAIDEVKRFKQAGGATVVDVTSIGIGRDPKGLVAVAKATGLHVVMGSGCYIATSRSDKMRKMSKEQMAEQIAREFEEGAEGTLIKPGVIGEIGVSDHTNPEEIKAVQAAAMAQKITKAALYIHQPIYKTAGHAILDIIEKEGANLSKVVLCHCDPTLDKPHYHDALAKRGAFIEYDQFGLEFISLEGPPLPRDTDRINAVAGQVQRGNLKNILISQDLSFKICMAKFGGGGYGHILENIKPLMLQAGITESELNTIMIDNPRRLLAF